MTTGQTGDIWRRIFEAIEAGDDATLRRIFRENPSLDWNFFKMEFLWERASKLGNPRVVAVLLAAGMMADPADRDYDFALDALTNAAWEGHLEVARLLLDAGADPDAALLDEPYCDPYPYSRCALYFALYKGHCDLTDLLEPVTSPEKRMRARAAVAKRHDDEFEAALPYPEETLWLLHATRCGDLDWLTVLIEEGGDVNVRLRPEESHRWLGSTPLSFAAAQGRMDMVEALLEAGADPELARPDGLTAADFAALNGHPEIAEFLRSRRRESGTGEV